MAYAVLPAAGSSQRMNSGHSKIFSSIGGRPLWSHAVGTFLLTGFFRHVFIMARSEDRETLASAIGSVPDVSILPGGANRQESVCLGLGEIDRRFSPGPADLVVIHDMARPLVSASLISMVLEEARECGAAIAAVPVVDCIKEAADGNVVGTLERSRLVSVQTPQAFFFHLIFKAHLNPPGNSLLDDAALIERVRQVTIVQGERTNIKVTTPEDLILAETFLQSRRGADSPVNLG